MFVFGGVLGRAVTTCQSSALLCARLFSTGSCTRIRMHAIPKLREVDRWTEKRSMFGVYDNIGILGGFKAHPKELIGGPVWLQGFRGNELQRLIRKKRMVGERMMAEDKHILDKRISFLYRRFNRYGKHR
ncbi:large ribosomal subunit protein mL51 [Carassius carassius]|uniref:large ribosomal subunit protein mL51 n=1 Tax=Carassius carassius TaxID=217509 RepID=UPI0028697842|nr:large ribosomal subunit protein mL51 [Carassius carassius]